MPKTTSPPLLGWLELSTTGVNARLDYILETVLVITDATAALVDKTSVKTVINPGGNAWRAQLEGNPSLKAIYDKNGLLKEVEAGLSITEAEQIIIQTLGRFGEPQDYVMAGSDIALTIGRQFVNHGYRRLGAWFRPSLFSVGSLGLAYAMTGRSVDMPTPSRKRKPRLIDEVQNNIESARAFLDDMK
jgi:oligoribonuclease (3'-5' exoribonuclease)